MAQLFQLLHTILNLKLEPDEISIYANKQFITMAQHARDFFAHVIDPGPLFYLGKTVHLSLPVAAASTFKCVCKLKYIKIQHRKLNFFEEEIPGCVYYMK